MDPIDEAATDWAEQNSFRHIDDHIRAFKSGAEWMRQQIETEKQKDYAVEQANH